eukprot:jgi/Ulvmu1/1872/UM012_0028.1
MLSLLCTHSFVDLSSLLTGTASKTMTLVVGTCLHAHHDVPANPSGQQSAPDLHHTQRDIYCQGLPCVSYQLMPQSKVPDDGSEGSTRTDSGSSRYPTCPISSVPMHRVDAGLSAYALLHLV